MSLMNGPFNQDGTKEVAELLAPDVFSFPKPTALLEYFFSCSVNEEEDKSGYYLDFFAGSATTGHAIFNLNRQDMGARKFIVVQMPETVDPNTVAGKAGYGDIGEIARVRLRQSSELIRNENSTLGLDMGFKSYRLMNSHYREWQNYHGDSVEELESLFDEHTTPLVDDWGNVEDGLFTEILLLEGFPLDSAVSMKSEYTENHVRRVECSFHENKLLVCLEDRIEQHTIDQLDLADGDTFICLDSAIDDQTKTLLADKGLIKTI
jgi:adenine-specific DNA-methyltransferase